MSSVATAMLVVLVGEADDLELAVGRTWRPVWGWCRISTGCWVPLPLAMLIASAAL